MCFRCKQNVKNHHFYAHTATLFIWCSFIFHIHSQHKNKQLVNSLFTHFNLVQLAVLAMLAVALIQQLGRYIRYIILAASSAPKTNDVNFQPLSVVICARNEDNNLKEMLPKVCEQDYNEFEVIVVNDCSEDETVIVLAEMEKKYTNLRHTNIDPDRKFMHGKKLAITIGVKSAKFEHIVFIDADCQPESNQWLKQIAASYTNNTEIVLGYGGYKQRKGLLDKLIRFDTLSIAMNYLGLALTRHPYMGVGRNMSYTKSLFLNSKGFQSHYNIISGDDDLFVNEHGTRKNTKVVATKESKTTSYQPETFVKWFKQKSRHITTWPCYRFGSKVLLAIDSIGKFLFFASIVILIWPLQMYEYALAGFGFRFLVQMITYKINMCKFGEKGFWLFIPIFELIMPLFYAAVSFSNYQIKCRNRK